MSSPDTSYSFIDAVTDWAMLTWPEVKVVQLYNRDSTPGVTPIDLSSQVFQDEWRAGVAQDDWSRVWACSTREQAMVLKDQLIKKRHVLLRVEAYPYVAPARVVAFLLDPIVLVLTLIVVRFAWVRFGNSIRSGVRAKAVDGSAHIAAAANRHGKKAIRGLWMAIIVAVGVFTGLALYRLVF